MSLGKMNTFIDIIQTTSTTDSEGFSVKGDTVLASVRAYKEDRHGNERWANRAAFSTASSLFQFRKIPGFEVKPDMFLVCCDGRYRILSVEDIRNRKLYLEALTEKIDPTVR